MTTFTLPVLPATAYRRSWLMGALREHTAYQRFESLLRALDPAAAAKVAPDSPAKLFAAVLRAVSTLFPVYDYFLDWDEEGNGEMDGDTLADQLQIGIPLVVYGWHYEHSSPAMDLAAARLNPYALELPDKGYALQEAGLGEWVMTWWPIRQKNGSTPPKAPHGRAFVEPWNGLADLARYVCGATGHQFLDVDFESQDGGIQPRWSIGEIRAIARDWKRTEPVWKRISDLADYVDARPRERLPLLDRALRHEPQALLDITRPTGRRTTLAYIFSKGKRK